MRISDWSSDVCSSDLSAPADAAATPTQIAQIVEQEFPTYDGDKHGDLNEAEFGAWMKKLRAATDTAADVESDEVTSWIGQALATAGGDKSHDTGRRSVGYRVGRYGYISGGRGSTTKKN